MGEAGSWNFCFDENRNIPDHEKTQTSRLRGILCFCAGRSDLIFTELSEYKNGSTLVVRCLFSRINREPGSCGRSSDGERGTPDHKSYPFDYLQKIGMVFVRAISSVGRAIRLHRKGRRFKSCIAHKRHEYPACAGLSAFFGGAGISQSADCDTEPGSRKFICDGKWIICDHKDK